MSWCIEMSRIVRGLIKDFGSPPLYSDERLKELICTGAAFVLMEVDFDIVYTVNLSSFTISPDPDADFQALVSLKTACIIATGEFRDAARNSVSVKDGPATIDMKERGKLMKDVAKWACDAYNKARLGFLVGDGSLGRAIVGPYAIGMGENTATYR